MAIQPIIIKPWDREKYPNLYSKTELKALKLMPSPNAKPQAVVKRPRRYGGDYFLYDIDLAVPFKKSAEQKAEEARKRKAAAELRKRVERLWKYREETTAAVSAMAPQKRYDLVVLDFETTGLDEMDEEILQVAIIDQDGNKLMSELCCPVVITGWPEAEAVHRISPADVKREEGFLGNRSDGGRDSTVG